MNEPKTKENTVEDTAAAESVGATTPSPESSPESAGREATSSPSQGATGDPQGGTSLANEAESSAPSARPGRSCRRWGGWALAAGVVVSLLALGAYAYARHVVQQEAAQRQALEERLVRLEQGS